MTPHKTMPQRCGRSRMRGLFLAVLLAGMMLFAGCATVKDWVSTPEPEVAASAEYGTITQVTSAAMAGREIRQGDIALTIDLDTGQVVVIVQTEDDIYTVGDRVRVIRNAENTFVRAQVQ